MGLRRCYSWVLALPSAVLRTASGLRQNYGNANLGTAKARHTKYPDFASPGVRNVYGRKIQLDLTVAGGHPECPLGESPRNVFVRLCTLWHRSNLIKYCIEPNYGEFHAILYQTARGLQRICRPWVY